MTKYILTGAIAGLVVASCGTASAQDSESARLHRLEQAVSQLQQENQTLKDQIHTEVASEISTLPAGKLNISTPVTEIKLYGELLIRYFVNEGVAAGLDAGDTGQKNRLRYRLRLGSDIKVTDGWSMGVVLETNNAARSANVTLGNGGFNDGAFAKGNTGSTTAVTSITTTSTGFVTGTTVGGKVVTGKVANAVSAATAKTASVVNSVNFQDALFVGQVFLKYQPTDWMTLEAGKFRPNLVSTRMIWDADICPEGFGENFKWHFGPSAAPAPAPDHSKDGFSKDGGYSKDGKGMVAPAPAPTGMSFDLFANFGQYIYEDPGFDNTFNTGTSAPFGTTPNAISNWMLGFQVGGKVNFTPTTYFQVAPTYYCYTGGGAGVSDGVFNGDNALIIFNNKAVPTLLTFNQTSTNDLSIIDFPVEFGFKVGNLPVTIFGDFADNLRAAERAEKAGHPDKREGVAYQIGASIGQIKKKGDWEIRGWWQHSEQFSLDPNIVDDDVFDGRLNMEGFYIKATYALADAVNVSVEYSNGHRIDSSLGTAGTGALGTAAGFPLQSTNLVYVNFGLKF